MVKRYTRYLEVVVPARAWRFNSSSRHKVMLSRKNFWELILIAIIGVFLVASITSSLFSMVNTPFNEFDEAHRAENAKRMREYGSFLTPISGSVFDRALNFRVPFEGDGFKFLYYHLERPPLIYDLMILSTLVFGSSELAYRLPSFLLGLALIVAFIFFIKKLPERFSIYSFFLALVCLLTSIDLWLSSQYAQLDTGLSFFLFVALLSLIFFISQKKEAYLFASAIGFALAVLSKGQPAVIFLPVLAFLLLTKKLGFKPLLRYVLYSSIIIAPWVVYNSIKFGLVPFLQTFIEFGFTSVSQEVVHHQAPFFWYARWWWDSFRPGWSLFLVFLAIDVIKRRIDWRKATLLVYILVNLFFFSVSDNKLWWYILPLVPAVCFYIYLSARDYLSDKRVLVNLGLAIIIASIPPLVGASNRIAIFYGIFYTLMVFGLLSVIKTSKVNIKFKALFVCAIAFSLLSFYIRFPKIIPYHWNVKDSALYFAGLPGSKCLWIYDIPTESVLFYSDSGEIYTYNSDSKPFGHCTNYIMTSTRLPLLDMEYRKGNMRLYKF